LRVAGLCVGVDDYQHLRKLQNAVRDAEAVSNALRSVPGCYSEAIRNPKTATELRHQLRTRLQDPDLAKHPPQLFVVYYAGHGFLQHGPNGEEPVWRGQGSRLSGGAERLPRPASKGRL
jgi:hypothetical protein